MRAARGGALRRGERAALPEPLRGKPGGGEQLPVCCGGRPGRSRTADEPGAAGRPGGAGAFLRGADAAGDGQRRERTAGGRPRGAGRAADAGGGRRPAGLRAHERGGRGVRAAGCVDPAGEPPGRADRVPGAGPASGWGILCGPLRAGGDLVAGKDLVSVADCRIYRRERHRRPVFFTRDGPSRAGGEGDFAHHLAAGSVGRAGGRVYCPSGSADAEPASGRACAPAQPGDRSLSEIRGLFVCAGGDRGNRCTGGARGGAAASAAAGETSGGDGGLSANPQACRPPRQRQAEHRPRGGRAEADQP